MLQATDKGLTEAEVARRLEQYGPNKLPESTVNPLLRFLGYMWNPLSWAMEAAAIISIALLDFADFGVIIGLLMCNAVIRQVYELLLQLTSSPSSGFGSLLVVALGYDLLLQLPRGG